MSDGDPSGAGKPPANLLVVVLWFVGIPAMAGAGLGLYKAVTEPPADPWLLALLVGGSVTYLIIWPSMLYRATPPAGVGSRCGEFGPARPGH